MTEDQIVDIIKALSAGSPPAEQSEANTALALTCAQLCEQAIKTQEALNLIHEVLTDLTKAAEDADVRIEELVLEARSRGCAL